MHARLVCEQHTVMRSSCRFVHRHPGERIDISADPLPGTGFCGLTDRSELQRIADHHHPLSGASCGKTDRAGGSHGGFVHDHQVKRML